MKKIWLKATALSFISVFSVSTLAANKPAVPSPIAPVHPKIAITVLEKVETTDSSGKKQIKLNNLKTNRISRSAKNHELCWGAFDAKFAPVVNVVEVFNSPAAATFEGGAGIKVTSSADKMLHTITSRKVSANGALVESCYRFSKIDPIGEYTLTVEIENVKFSPIKFTITE